MIHILLLLGLGLILAGLNGMSPYFFARNWRTTNAKVRSFSEEWVEVSMRYKPLRYYFPKVDYEYEINGKVFKSTRASFEIENIWQPEVDLFGTTSKKNEFFWAGWSNGSLIAIYVKPNNPSESVIIRDLTKKRRSHHLAILFGGVLIASLWGLLIYGLSY